MQARSIIAALAAFAGAAEAGSPPVNWPGAAPCNSTLQACIDAVPNGGVIRIVTDVPIGESLNLYNRSLSLEAGAGFAPRLAPTHWISVTTPSIAGDQTVNLSGLALTDGYVRIAYSGLGTGRYDVRGMTLQSTVGLAYIRVAASNASTVEATVYDNRVSGTPLDLNRGLIEFAAAGATLNASALYNQVTSTAPDAVPGGGIFVDATAGASGTTKIHANTVRGSFNRGGIFASEGLFTSTASDYAVRIYNNVAVCAATPSASGTGIGLTAGVGTLNAQAVNNTVSRCYVGLLASPWSGAAGTVQIEGLVKNNLLVAATALSFNPTHTTSLTNDYNLLNGGSSGMTLGTHTITAAARLVDAAAPRLTSASPALDAADTATLGLGLIFNGLPAVDADGMRRIKGAGGDADIGAYEFGDRAFRHTSTPANTSSYVTTFDDVASNGQPAANLIATPNFGGNAAGSGVANNNPFGIYYASTRWLAFNQDTVTAMPNGAKFNVFAPAAGSGAFRHVSTAANTVTRFTTIDNGGTNNVGNAIVLATQNWSAGASVYNSHPIGVNYSDSGGDGRWQIVNLDTSGATLPLNAGFNVYAQPPSPNAFRVTAAGGSSSIVLDHALLNGVPCAQVNTTRLWSGTTVNANHDVYYDSDGRWRIFSYAAMPAGTTFNVVVDPGQVFECTDRIFANGFQ